MRQTAYRITVRVAGDVGDGEALFDTGRVATTALRHSTSSLKSEANAYLPLQSDRRYQWELQGDALPHFIQWRGCSLYGVLWACRVRAALGKFCMGLIYGFRAVWAVVGRKEVVGTNQGVFQTSLLRAEDWDGAVSTAHLYCVGILKVSHVFRRNGSAAGPHFARSSPFPQAASSQPPRTSLERAALSCL